MSAADRIEEVAQAIRLECGAGDSWPVEFADSNLWTTTLRAIAAELRGAPALTEAAAKDENWIVEMCERYWNESNIGDAEIHYVLASIRAAALRLRAIRTERTP